MQTQEKLEWGALLRAVRAQYPHVYRAWFDELRPGRIEAGEIEVRVPDAARAAYLHEQCRQAFTDAAMEQTGRLISVSFRGPDDGGPLVISEIVGPALTRVPLSPDYTFDQFVVGPSNRLAHATCRGVCTQPGNMYNPLFIHGPSGLGKTHLLQAVCADLLSAEPARQVAYVSCDTFINDFIRAIEQGSLQHFRETTRGCDALVIDDIQFLARRESCQEEIFHTFNTLHQSRRQIILSADCSPAEIPTLEDRLASRFNWGMVAQIDPPNRETRQAILQKKARLRGVDVPDDVLDFVAERVEGNIRMLEGALTKLITEAQVNQLPLTIATARQALDGYNGAPARPLQIENILQIVSEHYSVKPGELLSRRRTRSVAYPRQVGMFLARRLTQLSLQEIGARFGGRDHSTVLHAERVIDSARTQNSEMAETLAALTRRLIARK